MVERERIEGWKGGIRSEMEVKEGDGERDKRARSAMGASATGG